MILEPGLDLTLRPMKYPNLYEMYVDAIKNTWTVDEVDLASDINDLKRMTPGEQHLIKRLVAFFATGDSIVANNLVLNLYQHINSPEARMYLSRQLFEEALHVQFYLTLLDTYLPNDKERTEAFAAIENIGNAGDIVIGARATLAERPDDVDHAVMGHDQIGGAPGLAFGFLDRGVGRQHHLDLEHVPVGRREELHRQGRSREEARDRQDDTRDQPDPGARDDGVQHAAIHRGQAAAGNALLPEGCIALRHAAIEPARKRGDHRHRQNEGRDHGEDDGDADHRNELAGTARH